MKLSPKAHRFVTEAIAAHGGRVARAIWTDFETSGGAALPPPAAAVAHAALSSLEERLAETLQTLDATSDAYADLSNDLLFIQAVGRDLRREVLGHEPTKKAG